MALTFGPFLLDHARAALVRGGVPVGVQPRVLAAIELLARSGGRILSREELLDALWPDVVVSDDALHQLLRKVRRALGDDPAEPRYLEAVPRRGWRFVAAVQEVGEDPGLIGRRGEVGALIGLLGGGQPVVIHGPAGVGKSRLARAVLPGATAVSLRDAHTAEDVVYSVAAALGLPAGAHHDPAAVGRALGHRAGATLLLEDVEGVVGCLPGLLTAWAGARMVLTSRARVAGCPTLELAPLPEDAAVALFARCFGDTFPRAQPPEPAEVRALVAGLDALPLAIELAVARLRVVPFGELLGRLARSHRVIEGAAGGARRSIEASVALLSPADRRLLGALSAFPDRFSARAVEGLAVVPAEGVLDGLGRLVDASLVVGEPGALRLLASVREVAADQRDPGDLAAWAGWVAGEVAPELPGLWRWDVGSLVRLAARSRELVGAVRVAGLARAHRETLAQALAGAVRYVGPWAVARDALEAVDAPGAASQALLAEYRIRTGDVPGALRLLEALAAPDAPADERAPRAFARFLTARLATAMGDPARGLALALEAQAIAGDHSALAALALEQAGLSALRAGRPDVARAHLAAASARCATPELALVHAVVTQNHAATLGILGDHLAASAELRSAERALASLPFPQLLASARANVGEALANLGDTAEAATVLRAALDLGESIGDAVVERHTVGLLGLCALAEGRVEDAERWLRRGVSLEAPPADRAVAWRRLALFEWDQRRRAVAIELLGRARASVESAPPWVDPLLSAVRGQLTAPPGAIPDLGALEGRLVQRLLERGD